MNYLPFFIVSLIAYSAITNAATTTEKASVTSTAPSTTTAAAEKAATTTAVPGRKVVATTTAHPKKIAVPKAPSKAKTTTKPSSKSPTKKPARMLAQHQSHRKSESQNIYIPTEFDNFIKNETLVQEITDCFLDRGPCNTERGKAVKRVIAKSIKYLCSLCTETQHSDAKRYIQHLQLQHPEDYDLFLKKYDPENKIQQFMQAVPVNAKDSLKSTDINILFF
ncbi:uncharacterized protein LOC113231446 [Hyposmocoma kahamanoa]|uniref:uncharacterized protein LOC113231446 n=1 Tax=Hyposmocoma kahamanoa TaxID=1477025 RepID=UPI000E6D8AF7|nr:uncharacterized protein LOC113231446 [Hyposmocoma kahamanoa]